MFQGFSPETGEFLWELSFHNERPWFLEHKEQFERVLNQPFRALAKACTEQLQARFPEMAVQCHVSRIYRDARRLFGRGPYKDHLWFTLWDSSAGTEGPAFWFEIGAATYGYGMGFFEAAPAEMELFRRRIDANPARFTRLAGEIAAAGKYRVIGPCYARPKGQYEEPVRSWYERKWVGVEAMRTQVKMIQFSLVSDLKLFTGTVRVVFTDTSFDFSSLSCAVSAQPLAT